MYHYLIVSVEIDFIQYMLHYIHVHAQYLVSDLATPSMYLVYIGSRVKGDPSPPVKFCFHEFDPCIDTW